MHCEHPLTMTLFIPRLSGISMDVAVPENTGQGSAGEVEQCTCPPGYRGPSCQVSLGPPHLPIQLPPQRFLAFWLFPHSQPSTTFLSPGL